MILTKVYVRSIGTLKMEAEKAPKQFTNFIKSVITLEESRHYSKIARTWPTLLVLIHVCINITAKIGKQNKVFFIIFKSYRIRDKFR